MNARRLAPLALLASAALALAACGDDGADETSATTDEPSARIQSTSAFEHVHGLATAPGDGALLVATHVGLFRVADGGPQRVGDATTDLMGFTVVDEDRYLASGHGAPGGDLPGNVGLIETRDGGRSWRPVSLTGEADFHVLEHSDGVLYGVDGVSGRFLRSEDKGREWAERTMPGNVFDLAISPRDADRLLAATDAGLLLSQDGGRRWSPVREDLTGLVAWPAADRLVLVDPEGGVHVSADAGRRWTRVGAAGGQPAALTASGRSIHVALADGAIVRSQDGGATWSEVVPAPD